MKKIIAITGAGQGLGKELAQRFHNDGHTVLLLGRTFSKIAAVAEKIGESALPIECDVSSPKSVKEAFGQIGKLYQRLDVLINNAAIYYPLALNEATDEQIAETLLIDLHGPILCTRAALPLLGKGSRIINVSSESVGMRHAMLSLYQTSKAGLERFTEAMQDELNETGVLLTLVRAGQMYSDDMQRPTESELRTRYMKECAQRGVYLSARGVSHVRHVADVFSYIVQLPQDLTISEINLQSVRSG